MLSPDRSRAAHEAEDEEDAAVWEKLRTQVAGPAPSAERAQDETTVRYQSGFRSKGAGHEAADASHLHGGAAGSELDDDESDPWAVYAEHTQYQEQARYAQQAAALPEELDEQDEEDGEQDYEEDELDTGEHAVDAVSDEDEASLDAEEGATWPGEDELDQDELLAAQYEADQLKQFLEEHEPAAPQAFAEGPWQPPVRAEQVQIGRGHETLTRPIKRAAAPAQPEAWQAAETFAPPSSPARQAQSTGVVPRRARPRPQQAAFAPPQQAAFAPQPQYDTFAPAPASQPQYDAFAPAQHDAFAPAQHDAFAPSQHDGFAPSQHDAFAPSNAPQSQRLYDAFAPHSELSGAGYDDVAHGGSSMSLPAVVSARASGLLSSLRGKKWNTSAGAAIAVALVLGGGLYKISSLSSRNEELTVALADVRVQQQKLAEGQKAAEETAARTAESTKAALESRLVRAEQAAAASALSAQASVGAASAGSSHRSERKERAERSEDKVEAKAPREHSSRHAEADAEKPSKSAAKPEKEKPAKAEAAKPAKGKKDSDGLTGGDTSDPLFGL